MRPAPRQGTSHTGAARTEWSERIEAEKKWAWRISLIRTEFTHKQRVTQRDTLIVRNRTTYNMPHPTKLLLLLLWHWWEQFDWVPYVAKAHIKKLSRCMCVLLSCERSLIHLRIIQHLKCARNTGELRENYEGLQDGTYVMRSKES